VTLLKDNGLIFEHGHLDLPAEGMINKVLKNDI
jgi:hypothetical protein